MQEQNKQQSDHPLACMLMFRLITLFKHNINIEGMVKIEEKKRVKTKTYGNILPKRILNKFYSLCFKITKASVFIK
jgi:hypothetical protein